MVLQENMSQYILTTSDYQIKYYKYMHKMMLFLLMEAQEHYYHACMMSILIKK